MAVPQLPTNTYKIPHTTLEDSGETRSPDKFDQTEIACQIVRSIADSSSGGLVTDKTEWKGIEGGVGNFEVLLFAMHTCSLDLK